MKRIIKLLNGLILVLPLVSCGPKKIVPETQYYAFKMENDSFVYEEYFGIDDTEYKIFNTQQELDDFNNLILTINASSTYSSTSPMFSYTVDFDIQKVVVTAAYIDHNTATFDVEVKEDDDTIYENISYTSYPNYVDYSTYFFLYLVIDKTSEKTIEESFTRTSRYQGGYVCYKPVLYFYPTSEMDLEITYVNKDNLITTYPKYESSWNIHLKEDGTFTYNDREFYAIYFDEYANYITNFEEGFYVTKDNAISFLEDSLDQLGFTNLEANEFMMYWLPILEENEQSLVYFETTDIRNAECPLLFSTQPDSMLRVIIHIKKVDHIVNIKEQDLPSFERVGFSVIEWGGIKY